MHADEVDIDADLVRRLLAAQFPEWGDLPIELVLPWGTDNAMYRLGDELVARLPRHAPTVAPLEKEREWLPRLAPHLPLPVPLPVGEGRPGEGYPFTWSVHRWLPGRNATLERMDDEDAVASDLARFIRALHRVDATGAPQPDDASSRGCPLGHRDQPTRSSISALGASIDAEAATAVWDSAVAAPEWDGPPVWIHGDLDGRNLLLVEGRLSGVIDWGTLGVGDPAYDVMVAWKMLSAATRDDFLVQLDVDEACWARARGLVVSQAVIALSYYTLETNAVLVEEAERWLGEALRGSQLVCASPSQHPSLRRQRGHCQVP